MKNAFKLGFLAAAITVSFAACKGSGSGNAADSTKKDSTTTVDSTAKVDSTKKDSTAAKADTTKKDTTKKM